MHECRSINSNLPPIAVKLRGLAYKIFPSPRKVLEPVVPKPPQTNSAAPPQPSQAPVKTAAGQSASSSSYVKVVASPPPPVPTVSPAKPTSSAAPLVDHAMPVEQEVDAMEIDEPSTPHLVLLAKEFMEKIKGYPFNAYPPNTLHHLLIALGQVSGPYYLYLHVMYEYVFECSNRWIEQHLGYLWLSVDVES